MENHTNELEVVWNRLVAAIQESSIADYIRYQDSIRWGLPAYEWCHEKWCRHDR
jgi:hypothetical protein